MRKIHSVEFVLKIVNESNYTLAHVRDKVNEYTGKTFSTVGALQYLQRCTADYMRMILRFNTF